MDRGRAMLRQRRHRAPHERGLGFVARQRRALAALPACGFHRQEFLDRLAHCIGLARDRGGEGALFRKLPPVLPELFSGRARQRLFEIRLAVQLRGKLRPLSLFKNARQAAARRKHPDKGLVSRAAAAHRIERHDLRQHVACGHTVEHRVERFVEAIAVDHRRCEIAVGERGHPHHRQRQHRAARAADRECPETGQPFVAVYGVPGQQGAVSAVRIGVVRSRSQGRVHEHVGLGGTPQQIGPVRADVRKASCARDFD